MFSKKTVDKLRAQALYYQKHGRYDCGTEGTPFYRDYWKEQLKRSVLGVVIDGVYISGYHYFYLNFCPIMQTKVVNIEASAAERVKDFPKFWDVDYKFFILCEIAENGMANIKDPETINHIDLHLFEDQDWTKGGKDMLWLKPRGVGASFKGGVFPARNYFCIPDSVSILVAAEKEFLTKDGVFSKFLDYASFINSHTGFKKRSEIKNDRNNMHIRASYRDEKTGSEHANSFKSEVIGITLRDDVQKIRGKRAKYIGFEEVGKFPSFVNAWEITTPSVHEPPYSFGMRVGWGTGGTEGSNFDSFRKMAFEPQTYNILHCDNVWDEGKTGRRVCFFTPSYEAIGFMDAAGNSNVTEAKAYHDEQRALKAKSGDPYSLLQYKSENPYNPSEALFAASVNIFHPDQLDKWKAEIESSKHLRNFGTPGYFYTEGSGDVLFQPDESKHPVLEYPIKKNKDNSGCPVIYYAPRRVDGKIPDNLYIVCLDPYAHEGSTGSDSVGAAYVLMNPNGYPHYKPDDCIVASYVGRPHTLDEFNKTVFDMAKYYNAKIAFENDRGDTIQYAKTNKQLGMLAAELELEFNSSIPKSSVRRGFGMHIASGRADLRKFHGDKYIQQWLHTLRSVNENETGIYNYHLIYDSGLLQELIDYNEEGNFDRVSALRIGMYYMKELEYQERKVVMRSDPSSSLTRFFKGKHFK